MDNPYTYILIRTDLSAPQQIVQASHAAQEAGKRWNSQGKDHIVLIAVKNEDDLLDQAMKLEMKGIRCCTFFEPDIDSYTAIATEPLRNDQRQHMKRYRLYTTKT